MIRPANHSCCNNWVPAHRVRSSLASSRSTATVAGGATSSSGPKGHKRSATVRRLTFGRRQLLAAPRRVWLPWSTAWSTKQKSSSSRSKLPTPRQTNGGHPPAHHPRPRSFQPAKPRNMQPALTPHDVLPEADQIATRLPPSVSRSAKKAPPRLPCALNESSP